MRLSEKIVRTGYFWLPSSEIKCPGTLTIDDGGEIELEITGQLDNNFISPDLVQMPRIVGEIEIDGAVTLENCFYRTRNIGNVAKSIICGHVAYIGVLYEAGEEAKFSSFSFSFDCIDEWVGITGIDVQYGKDYRSAKVSYNRPDTINIQLVDGFSLAIYFAYKLPSIPSISEAKISQRPVFSIKSSTERGLDDFIELSYKIVTLMCIAIDEIVSINNVTVESKELTTTFNDHTQPVSIKTYYPSLPYTEKKPKQNHHYMLFTYKTISEKFESILINWLTNHNNLSPALNLYFSTKNGAYRYTDSIFLALCQGIETYHRRTTSETLMPEEEFKSLVSEILENCPIEKKTWLQGRLMFGNEINLAKRITQIIQPFEQHFGDAEYRKRFVRKIVDTRNYLTHYSNQLEKKSMKGRELWDATQKLEALYQLHILRVIGFSDTDIDGAIQKSHRLSQKLRI
ncbi:hypothetical protein GWZ48_004039 [Vibrio fluvialis]|nr:hypothetical protein [Vibrio fluvialis]